MHNLITKIAQLKEISAKKELESLSFNEIKKLIYDLGKITFLSYEHFCNNKINKCTDDCLAALICLSNINSLVPPRKGLIIWLDKAAEAKTKENSYALMKINNDFFINVSRLLALRQDYIKYSLLDHNLCLKNNLTDEHFFVLFEHINLLCQLLTNIRTYSLADYNEKDFWI